MINVSALKTILEESKTSPEELSRYFRISNMTLRRMLSKSDKTVISAEYHANFREGVLALIRDQKIEPQSKSAQNFMLDSSQRFTEPIFSILGLPVSTKEVPIVGEAQVKETLITIGSSPQRQKQVTESIKDIMTFSKQHKTFASSIQSLLAAISLKAEASPHKAIAFGALFYLLMPMDFAPDYIPAFGLMDDLGVVTIASHLSRPSKSSRSKTLKK